MAAVDPRDDPASVVAAQRVLLELWTILGGQHIPVVADDFAERLITWLLAHRKPAP